MVSDKTYWGVVIFLIVLLWGVSVFIVVVKEPSTPEVKYYAKETYSQVNYYSVERSEQCMNKTLEEMYNTTIIGMSMLPAIDTYSTVYYVMYDTNKPLVPGDVIITVDYIHRVVGVYKGFVITKGDNNAFVDKRVNNTEIISVACATFRS